MNQINTSALDPEIVKSLAAGGKIDLRQFKGNPEAMAAAKAALALRAEKEKAEKLAAKQAAKEEKMAIKTGAAAGYVPMEGVQNAGVEEAAFEVDHSSMKPLENMSALEMFMTTWNVWKGLVMAKKGKATGENAPALALVPAPVKR